MYCYLEFKLRYLKNLTLFSIRVKELSEPIRAQPLQRQMEASGCTSKDWKSKEQTKIITLNANNARTNMVCIQDLLKSHDIVCLQEHWLYGFEASFLHSLSASHSCHWKCVHDHDPIDPTRKPRGHGGVAIFWPSEWDGKVTKHEDGDWRFVVITIRGSEVSVCVISVYMPVAERDTLLLNT